jgi:ankyrin repeat protein
MKISNEQYTQLLNVFKVDPCFNAENIYFFLLEQTLRKNMDIDEQTLTGNTTLHSAVYIGNAEAVLLLLQWGANKNIKNSANFTPYKLASDLLMTNSMSFYNSKSFIINFKLSTTMFKIIDHFIAFGADIKDVNYLNQTLLHLAVIYENISLIKFLLEQDINIDHKDKYGKTALDISVERKSLEILKLLINKGAKITETALDNLNNLTSDLVKDPFSEYNINKFTNHIKTNYIMLNFQDEEGNTNLHITLNKKSFNAARELVSNGASLLTPNKKGIKPIDLINEFIQNPPLFPAKPFTLNRPLIPIKASINKCTSIAKFKLYIEPLINKYIANKILSEDDLNKLIEALKAKNDGLGTSRCKSYKDYYGEKWYKVLEVCKDISAKNQGCLVINSLPKELLKEIGIFVYYDSEYYQYEKALEPIVGNYHHQTTLLGTESIE